jgi:hypothetical protein
MAGTWKRRRTFDRERERRKTKEQQIKHELKRKPTTDFCLLG